MINVLSIVLAGGLGALLRWGVTIFCARNCTVSPLMSLIFVNYVGSLLIGLLTGACMDPLSAHISQPLLSILTTGFCGGFTSYSSYQLEQIELYQKTHTAWVIVRHSLVHLLGSWILCACGLYLGQLW